MDIRVAAYGVIIQDDRILLAHWNEGGRSGWTLPGGGIEPGEHPADAARREILEETGVIAELHELLGVDSIVISEEDRISGAGPLQGIRIVYLASIVGGDLRNEAQGSTDEAAWFDLAEVAHIPHVELVDIGIGFTTDTNSA